MKKFMGALCLSALFFSAALLGEESAKIANLRDFIESEIKAGKTEINIPQGRYFVKPLHGSHLRLTGLKNVVINGNGAEFICTQTCNAFDILDCENLRIENLVIDYDPLPYTQGKITAIAPDKMTFEVEIFDGYGDVKNLEWGNRLEIFDQNTRRLKVETYGGYKLEKINDRKFKLIKPEWCRARPFQNEVVGDIIALSMPTSEHAGGHAVSVRESKKIVFKNVTLYASPAFGFWEGECDDNLYDNVLIARRDSDDFAKRASPRIRSLNADGFHSTSAAKGPTYLNCETSWNGDDSIAINGLYYLVYSSEGNKMRVASRQKKFPFAAGDKIEIYLTDGSVEYAKITDVAPDVGVTEEEAKWCDSLNIYPEFKKHKTFTTDAYTVTIDRNINVPKRSMIMNAAKMGNGFKIKGGKYGNNRSRGLIIKTGNGSIEDVVIEGSWMESIKIAPEWFWFEGGHTENLVVKNCTIRCGAGPAISINSPTLDGKSFSKAGANNNIKILKNKFYYVNLPVIFATSIKDLQMSKNKFEQMDEGYYIHSYPTHMGVVCTEPVTLINCEEKPKK